MAARLTLDWYSFRDDEEDKEFKDMMRPIIEAGDAAAIESGALRLDKAVREAMIRHPPHSLNPGGYIALFHDYFIYLSCVIPHDSPQQDALVKLLSTLQGLPDRPGSDDYLPYWKPSNNSYNFSHMVVEAFEGKPTNVPIRT